MADTKPTVSATQNKTPLYIVCIALLVAVVLAIVGFSGKTSATQQANELSARVEELTATVADLEAAAATAASDLEAKAGELETAKSDLEAAAAAKTEVDGQAQRRRGR